MASSQPRTNGGAAANQPNTFAPKDCACFVCEALRSREKTPWTEGLSWRADELYANIVGFRRRDSIHNTFDDRLMVFMRPMAASAAAGRTLDALRAAVGAEFIDDLGRCVAKASAHVRVCECKGLGGAAPGTWVVLWMVITTDPGETLDKAYKGYLDQVDAVARLARELPEDASGDTKAQRDQRAQLAQARKKVAAYESDPSRRRIVFRAALDGDPALRRRLVGRGGGIIDGRGMMALGKVPNRYRIGIHHLDDVIHAELGAQAALHCVEGGGWRMWAGATVLEARHDPKRPRSRESALFARLSAEGGRAVVRHVVGGDLGGAPWSATKRLVWRAEGEGRWVVEDSAAPGAAAPVGADDVLFLDDHGVAGTNHHRSHYVHVKDGQLAEGKGTSFGGGAAASADATSPQAAFTTPSQAVNGWSEGCQVNPGFHAFNLFFRLTTLSVRWRCHGAKRSAEGCAVVAPGPADALSETERMLFKGRGAERNDEALRSYAGVVWARWQAAVADLPARTKAEGDATTARDAAAQAHARKPSKATERALTNAEKGLAAAQDARRKAQGALDDLVARYAWLQAYDERRRSFDEAAARHAAAKGKQAKADAKAELDAAATALAERVGSFVSDALRREAAAHFRVYVPVLQKQFVRGCDLGWTCPERLDYTLVEVGDDAIATLDERFRGAAMLPFKVDENLVIG